MAEGLFDTIEPGSKWDTREPTKTLMCKHCGKYIKMMPSKFNMNYYPAELNGRLHKPNCKESPIRVYKIDI